MPVVRTPVTKGFNPKESWCAYILIRRKDPVVFLGSSSWALKLIRPKRTTPNAISTIALVCLKFLHVIQGDSCTREIPYNLSYRPSTSRGDTRTLEFRQRWLNRYSIAEKSWWYMNILGSNSIFCFTLFPNVITLWREVRKTMVIHGYFNLQR